MLYGSPLPRVVAMTRIGEGSENENFFFSFLERAQFLLIFFFIFFSSRLNFSWDWTFFYLENKAENVVCKVITFVRSFLLLLNIPRRHFYL